MQLYYPSLDTQMPPNKILITVEISFLYYPILSKFFSGDFFCVLFLGEKKYMLSISKDSKKKDARRRLLNISKSYDYFLLEFLRVNFPLVFS